MYMVITTYFFLPSASTGGGWGGGGFFIKQPLLPKNLHVKLLIHSFKRKKKKQF